MIRRPTRITRRTPVAAGTATGQLTQRERNCLAAIVAGRAIGVTDADIYAAAARVNAAVTQDEVIADLGVLAARSLITYSRLDNQRWVATAKGAAALR